MWADGLCHLDEDTGASDDDPATPPSWGPDSPERSAEESLALLVDTFDRSVVDPVDVGRVYNAFMEQRESDCPMYEDSTAEGVPGVWFTPGCTTTTDWTYTGQAQYMEMCEEQSDEHGAFSFYNIGMLAQFQNTDPDGELFVGGGNLVHSCLVEADGTGACESFMGGTWAYGGAHAGEVGGGWMGDGSETSLFIEHTWTADSRLTELTGGIDLAGFRISFEDTILDWESCDGRPTGAVRIRDPSGWWHELHLDDDCSGCGQMSWRGIDEGRHCIDLATPLTPVVESWEAPCVPAP